ncbi:hypothetical protein F5Y03DRAFT_398448 [Xylaria venustula]|nr:hypothetical protein F5Y03DRAFT_398448 [Xylaria venustula]
MPRKVRIPADPAQNRENQQRSRARRRAYLADLEARVRHSEARDMTASLEMQRAAREVAWVNARLLEMLAARGVGKGEVDEYLGRCRERERDCRAGSVVEGVDVRDSRYAGASTAARASGAESKGDGEEDGLGTEERKRIGGAGVDSEGPERALITSCDAAASIIAGFQGHGDVSRARKALGCDDVADCHVKNTRLFQLMDETGCS